MVNLYRRTPPAALETRVQIGSCRTTEGAGRIASIQCSCVCRALRLPCKAYPLECSRRRKLDFLSAFRVRAEAPCTRCIPGMILEPLSYVRLAAKWFTSCGLSLSVGNFFPDACTCVLGLPLLLARSDDPTGQGIVPVHPKSGGTNAVHRAKLKLARTNRWSHVVWRLDERLPYLLLVPGRALCIFVDSSALARCGCRQAVGC